MIRPLRDFLMVEPLPDPLSPTLQVIHHERTAYAVVRAAGPGKYDKHGKLTPTQVKVGDKVRFGKFAFPKIEDKYLLIQEADVAGIVE